MGYVSGYKYDVFVSYSHADNAVRPGDHVDSGWVSRFADFFTKALDSAIGHHQVELAFDLRTPSSTISEYLEKVRSSAIFLVIGSRTYIRSEGVAMAEFRAFHDTAGDHKRIFAIERISFDRTALGHNVATDVVFRRFYNRIEGADIPYAPASELFEVNASVLAQQVCERLEELAGRTRLSTASRANARQRSKSVLLADVPGSLVRHREEMASFLSSDVEVLPASSFPTDGPAFEHVFSDALAQCDMAVQLLDEDQGAIYNQMSQSICQYQYDAIRRSGKPFVLWRSPELKVADLRASGQIPASHLRMLEDPSMMVMGLEELKKTVRDQASAPTVPDIVTQPGSVFIHSETSDAPYAQMFGEAFHKENLSVLYNPSTGADGGTGTHRNALKTRLTQCDILVYIFKNAPLDWITEQIGKFSSFTIDRKRPPQLTAICVENPEIRREINALLPAKANSKDFFIEDWRPERVQAVVREMLR